jgi:thymidylate synthase ThyX
MAYLSEAVTNTEGNVYSFYETIDPTIVAAAMARLSRFGGDMRALLLKEFAGKAGQEEKLLRRVLTQFGDDSVTQLGYLPIVVENASNWLTKQLEWGRLAAYLEQSTRYIYYDQKTNGRYRYYIPEYLPENLLTEYRETLDKVFTNYALVVREMTEYFQKTDPTPESERDASWRIAIRGKACDAARGLLPVATTSTVGIVGSGQAIDNLIMHLLSQELPEAKETGQAILAEVRKKYAIFFERTDLENRGKAIVAHKKETRRHVNALASKLIPADSAHDVPATANLIDYTPHDESDLIAHMLYPHTNLGFADLEKVVAQWSDEEKQSAFELYMGQRGNRRHKPGRALEIAHYTFELVCDYGSFRDLQRHRMVDALEWQQLSPNLGFDVPDPVKDAGLGDLYQETHALVPDLYHRLIREGFTGEAQYITLLSSKMRWKVTINARAAFHFVELRTQPAGHIGYRKLTKLMHDEIAKVHPKLAAAMIFVNREDNDPATSRLEQNRRAQEKLKALGLDGLLE